MRRVELLAGFVGGAGCGRARTSGLARHIEQRAAVLVVADETVLGAGQRARGWSAQVTEVLLRLVSAEDGRGVCAGQEVVLLFAESGSRACGSEQGADHERSQRDQEQHEAEQDEGAGPGSLAGRRLLGVDERLARIAGSRR